MRNLNVKLKDGEWEALADEAESVGASISNLVRIKLGIKPVTFSTRKTVLIEDPPQESNAASTAQVKGTERSSRSQKSRTTTCAHHNPPETWCSRCDG